MLILMTLALTLMQGHNWLAEEKIQCWIIWTIMQAISMLSNYVFTWPWLWKHLYGLTLKLSCFKFPVKKGYMFGPTVFFFCSSLDCCIFLLFPFLVSVCFLIGSLILYCWIKNNDYFPGMLVMSGLWLVKKSRSTTLTLALWVNKERGWGFFLLLFFFF